jgi:mannose-6-phosphate isomerase-like protein (cupin superfamily)
VLRIGSSTRAVAPGDCIFVAAGADHRFEDISDDLELLVVFAPPYSGD